jgi:hypothetical protein
VNVAISSVAANNRGFSPPAPVFIRSEKFTSGFSQGSHGSAIGVPLELANMPAQQQEPSKNYIGILSDRLEDQREAMLLVKSNRPMKDYLRNLMAAVLNRGGNAR